MRLSRMMGSATKGKEENMSVIVKGMEIPEYCFDCPLHNGENGRCTILGITVCDYIPKACPLVEVVRCKECKHGRPYKHTKEYVSCEVDCDPIDRDSDFYCADGKRRE